MARKNNKNKNNKPQANARPKSPKQKGPIPKGTFKRGGAYAGGAVGNLLGSQFGLGGPGRALGSALGGYGGDLFSRLVGTGDYTVESNSLYDQGVAVPHGETVPGFGVKGHAVTICHREFVKDLKVPGTPTAFSLDAYRINPGNAALFPWLSDIAKNFQQYRIVGMVMEFKSMSGDVTAGGALGSVMMATDYNALGSDFADKLHMENSEYAVSTKPSMGQLHSIECARHATAQDLLYVRNSNISSDQSHDARLYDLGLFQIATVGLPGAADTVLGELWMSYHIELYKPIVSDDTYNSGHVYCSTGVAKATPFGTAPLVSGSIVTVLDTDEMEFLRSGEFLVAFNYIGNGANMLSPVLTFSDGGVSELIQFAHDAGRNEGASLTRVRVTDGEVMTVDFSAIGGLDEFTVRLAPYAYDYALDDAITLMSKA